jgi:hypothetical protein
VHAAGCMLLGGGRPPACSWWSLKKSADFCVGSVSPSHLPSRGMPGELSSAA